MSTKTSWTLLYTLSFHPDDRRRWGRFLRKEGPRASSCVGVPASQEAAVRAFVRCFATVSFLQLFPTRLNVPRRPPWTGRSDLARFFQCCRSASFQFHATDSFLGGRRFVHARRPSLPCLDVAVRHVVSFGLVFSSLVQVHVCGRGCAVELLQGTIGVHGLLEMLLFGLQDVLEPSSGSLWMALDVHFVHGNGHCRTSDRFVDARGTCTRAHGVVCGVPGAFGERIPGVQGLQQRQDVSVHVASRHVKGRGHEHGPFVVGQLRHVSFYHVQVRVFPSASSRIGAYHASKHVCCASWRLATLRAQPDHGTCRAHRATPTHVRRLQSTLGGLLSRGVDGRAQSQLQARTCDQPRHVSTHVTTSHGRDGTDVVVVDRATHVYRKGRTNRGRKDTKRMHWITRRVHDRTKTRQRWDRHTEKGTQSACLTTANPVFHAPGGRLASVQENLAHGSSNRASFFL